MDVSSLIDVTRQIPSGVEGFLTGGGVVLISTLFIILFLNIKRNKGKILPILIGVVGYVVFAVLGYNVVASLVMQIPGMADAYKDNATSAMIVLSMVSALMFTLARLATVKMMAINGYQDKGSFYNAGIGLSFGNIIVFGISIISMLVWCAGIAQNGLEGLFATMGNEETVISNYESIQPLFNYRPEAWFFMSLSYAMDIFLYAALMWADGCAATNRLPKVWHLFTGLMNFAVILPFDLYDGTTTAGYLIPFLVKAAFLAAVLCVIVKFTGHIDDEETAKKVMKKMPKIGNLSKL